MSRISAISTVARGTVAAILVVSLSPLWSSRPAWGKEALASHDPSKKFVVHEWGTFIPFAGSNGVQLDFRPLLDEDLPRFVLNRERQAGARPLLSKGALFAPLRMETPVTYFYVDEPRVVRVKVQFPQGLLTEFYPPVRSMLPAYDPKTPLVRGPSELDWGQVMLIPQASLRPNLGDEALSELLAKRLMAAAPPHDLDQTHYGAARETDSALVAVNLPALPTPSRPVDIFRGTLAPPQGLHVEQFLFYRGVGTFDLPLQATVDRLGRVVVTHTGADPIRSLFLVDVQGPKHQQRILRATRPSIDPKGTVTLDVMDSAVSLADLQKEVLGALVAEGLFEKEAAAMVKTWSDSWFQEQGLRLFYIVPQSMTDEVLPLTIEPAPEKCVRVLVGRMELMPPAQETAIEDVVRAYRLAREAGAVRGESAPLPMPGILADLGRFAEPALVRVRELTKDRADADEAGLLIARLRDQR